MSKVKIYILSMSIFVLILSFQNCAKHAENDNLEELLREQEVAKITLQAVALINTKCAGCHNGNNSFTNLPDIKDFTYMRSNFDSLYNIVYFNDGSPQGSAIYVRAIDGHITTILNKLNINGDDISDEIEDKELDNSDKDVLSTWIWNLDSNNPFDDTIFQEIVQEEDPPL